MNKQLIILDGKKLTMSARALIMFIPETMRLSPTCSDSTWTTLMRPVS